MEIDVSKLSSQPNVKVDRLFITVFLTDGLEKQGFKGFAKSLTATDNKGPFDILPGHENFVTKFSKNLKIVTESNEEVVYENKSGIIETANNVVRIFVKD